MSNEQHDHGHLWWDLLRARQRLLWNSLLPEHSGLLQRHLLCCGCELLQWHLLRLWQCLLQRVVHRHNLPLSGLHRPYLLSGRQQLLCAEDYHRRPHHHRLL
jgi:hypothetical protein